MSEENNNEVKNEEFKVEVNKEELKSQTKDTVNQVKETFKNTDFKNEANETKNFVVEMIKKPFSVLNDIITEKTNGFGRALILMIILMSTYGLSYFISIITTKYLSFNIQYFLTKFLSPLLYVLAFTVSIVLLGGKDKKKLSTILAGLTVAFFPRVLTELMLIVYTIIKIKAVGYIYTIISSAIALLSMALTFIAVKGLISQDDENKMFRKVAVIVTIAYTIIEILEICGIY